jgi:TPR repeat protein
MTQAESCDRVDITTGSIVGVMMKNQITACCAECGEEGGVSLKMCQSCMLVKYCNAACKRNHWPKHKKDCKLRAAELHDEALFKDPPPKEDCPICFLPMPEHLICCVSLPPATLSSVPVSAFATEHEELASMNMEEYYPCCGKSICKGCLYSFNKSGNIGTCPFCNSNRATKTDEEDNEDLMKRVEANDVNAICLLAGQYNQGLNGLQQDHTKAMEQFARAAELGCSKAHYQLGWLYHEGGILKKAKFHWEAAAMAGDEVARWNLGCLEAQSGNTEQVIKHLTIAASAGEYNAMHGLRKRFEKGLVSRESIDSTLSAYNNSCAEMRSEARDAYIQTEL